eukprot:CAMPEP_0182545454 /NCGR_PEP_ID=MMETSP1323-20130603/34576_1 /TAXON_ID=236787 /ORGANISM="Florenciella parvula, Strain RCC1693" /LENGTH=121 /DNA_ID=CAMNT_0024756609 /DNA_START=30 /DNA_END=395 /DNA_ORIENTATION=-
MANLVYKDDSNVEVILERHGSGRIIRAMHNLGSSVQVQAAGSWALAAMAGKNEDLREQALADGAAEACEAAISRHGKHEGEDGSAAGGNGAVARNSRLALDRLHGIEPEEEAVTDDQCSVM